MVLCAVMSVLFGCVLVLVVLQSELLGDEITLYGKNPVGFWQKYQQIRVVGSHGLVCCDVCGAIL